MDINEFLQSCVGNWFSQRSSYHFEQQQGKSDKSELAIEWLSSDAPEVINLCQTHQINPKTTLGAQKVSWDNSSDWGKAKQVGSSVLVFISDTPQSSQGLIFSNSCQTLGKYELRGDESLFLILEDSQKSIEERIWFASPNLRLRTSIIKHPQGFNRTAFYSEIRKLPPKEQPNN